MRAPDTPIGGPNEIPDPLTLSRSCQLLSALRPQALTTARTCGAKASSSSIRSIASILYDEKTLPGEGARWRGAFACPRSEEHTSELLSLLRISYAVFCLKKKKSKNTDTNIN